MPHRCCSSEATFSTSAGYRYVQLEDVGRIGQVLGHPSGQRQRPAEARQYHLGALLLGQLCHPVSERVVRQHPCDQDALAFEKCRHGGLR